MFAEIGAALLLKTGLSKTAALDAVKNLWLKVFVLIDSNADTNRIF